MGALPGLVLVGLVLVVGTNVREARRRREIGRWTAARPVREKWEPCGW